MGSVNKTMTYQTLEDAVAASVAMQTHMQNAENRMASKLD